MKKHFNLLFFLMIVSVLFSCDGDSIKPGSTSDVGKDKFSPPEHSVQVAVEDVVQTYEAVGTIHPLTQSVIESQVTAKVEAVESVPGDTVAQGKVLVSLDDRHFRTRLEQAKEGLEVAQNNLNQAVKAVDESVASLDQAASTYDRTKKLFESNVVPSQQYDIDKADYLKAKARVEKAKEAKNSAEAAVRQAREVVKEAEIALGYTEIKSPASGVVVKRMIDPGDMAIPGKPLLTVQTSGALRLEANVREGLIGQVTLGNHYEVRITNVNKTITSTIEEIVPYADPATRTFLVKAALPRTHGIYPGMFGRLRIPVGKEKTLLIPKTAVIRVGQLEQVLVKRENRWQRLYIKTGKLFDDKIEVLSGLNGDDTIGYR